MSIPNVSAKRKGSSDPRYKNGVYTNTNGQKRQEAAARHYWGMDNHPVSCGWAYDHWNFEHDLAVYRQNGHQLMRSPNGDGWIIENGNSGQQWLVTGGSLRRATNDVIGSGPICPRCGGRGVKEEEGGWLWCMGCGHRWKVGQ